MRDGTLEKLGPWICVPLLLWAVVWMVVLSMPSASCEGNGSEDTGGQEVLLVVVVAAASLFTAAGALFRLVNLGRAGGFKAGRDLTMVGVVVAALVAAAAATTSRFPSQAIQVLPLVGLLLTGLALLALLVAWAAGVRANGVGLLLPLYLFGAALLAYPLVGLLGLASSSGVFC
jgi:hypothetical protein